MHNVCSLIVVFNSARLVRQGEELMPFAEVISESEGQGTATGSRHEASAQLHPKMA
jgi:hypothetical protein